MMWVRFAVCIGSIPPMPDASHPVRTRGADLLWRALEDLGVTRVFSLSGNHVMAVYDAAFGRPICSNPSAIGSKGPHGGT